MQYLKTSVNVARNCQRFLEYYGKSFQLSDFTNPHVSRYVSKRRKQVSNATVNRELATLKHFLRKAEFEWEFEVGRVNFKYHMLKEPECRVRYLTYEEAKKLINCASNHLKPVIKFALLTGLRSSNVLGLRWEQIDFESGLMNFKIKSNIPGGKRFSLPITNDIKRLLSDLQPKEQGFIFMYKGKPMKSVQTSFKRALKRAKIEDFRFHDLRHTAATWLLQEGMPLDMVQRILAHTKVTTTTKYAHRIEKDVEDKFSEIHAKSHFGHILQNQEN
ncbi:MAG: site-specific integrase [Vicingaceae bacterium]